MGRADFVCQVKYACADKSFAFVFHLACKIRAFSVLLRALLTANRCGGEEITAP